MHLSDELLSAHLDGELTLSEATAAAAHLRTCAGCAETARLYAALDERLTSIPALACASALSLVSAQLDGELVGEESAIATAHLVGCADCRANVQRWSAADQALAALPPSRPSARVDLAIAALGREPAGRRLPRIAWPVPALAGVLAVSLVLALSIGNATPPVPSRAIVASVQLSVLNPKTGTLYVLHPEDGTVAALNSTTLERVSLITVGGTPTALALDESTNAIVVLDASAKVVTFIDSTRNTVTSSAAVAIPGRPTSLQVDPSGNLVVTSVVASAGASSAPAAGAAGSGAISVFNGGTQKLESVKQLDVAAQVFVLEPNGNRALLISASATTLVDARTYLPLATASGGVAAAFAVTGDDFAILSMGPAGATVTFARRAESIQVGGTARGIAPLPDGGFAVLADSDGRGRITLLLPDGTTNGSIEAAADGRDLAYDPATRQFTVIGSARVSKVALPPSLAVLPAPVVNPRTSASPLPTVAPSPAVSAATAPSPAASVAPAVAPATEAPERANGLIPSGARLLWPGTYFKSLGSGHRVDASAADGTRIWFVDDANRVGTFHPTTGAMFEIAQLPADANVTRIVISPNHVYLADSGGVLYVVTVDSEQLTTIPLPLLTAATAIAASADERIWLATNSFGLVGFDPRTRRTETISAGIGLSAVTTDALGRIWVAAGDRQSISSYDPLTRGLMQIPFAHSGSVTSLSVDGSGALWIGTSDGAVSVMRNKTISLVRVVDGKILELFGGPAGTWYVAQGAGDILMGPAGPIGETRHAPVSASRPYFDSLGRAWQVDRSADGFYVTLPGNLP